MSVARILGCLCVVTVASVQIAAAQGVEDFRTVYVSFGTGVGLSGHVIEEATGTIANRPAVTVEQAFTNHYSDGFRFKAGGSFGIDYNNDGSRWSIPLNVFLVYRF